MKRRDLVLPGAMAALVGVVQAYALVFCWTHLAMHGLVPAWLATLGLSGHQLQLTLLPLAFLIGVTISLPAALVLGRLRPLRRGLYLRLAVVPTFAWLLWALMARTPQPDLDAPFVTGWLVELLALPAAAWLVAALRPARMRARSRLLRH